MAHDLLGSTAASRNGAWIDKGARLDRPSFAEPQAAYSIWIRPNDDGRWRWELIDGDGRTGLQGAAPGRDAAMATAQFASDALEAFKRIGARRS